MIKYKINKLFYIAVALKSYLEVDTPILTFCIEPVVYDGLKEFMG